MGEAHTNVDIAVVDCRVSIPRAGFWWVKPAIAMALPAGCTTSFNPSGGILVGEATATITGSGHAKSSFNPSGGILVGEAGL